MFHDNASLIVFRFLSFCLFVSPAFHRCPDGGSKLAIAYCNLEFQATLPDTPKESYIFHVGGWREGDLHAKRLDNIC